MQLTSEKSCGQRSGRVGSAVPSSARGIDGGPRRSWGVRREAWGGRTVARRTLGANRVTFVPEMGGPFRSQGPKPRGSHGDRRHAGVDGSLNSGFLYLNETASRWENTSYSASLRRSCFALASRQKSLAQTAPLARATNLRIKANRVPPRGFVQEPVPARPRRLAVEPSSVPALCVQASSFSLPHARPTRGRLIDF